MMYFTVSNSSERQSNATCTCVFYLSFVKCVEIFQYPKSRSSNTVGATSDHT